MRLDHQTIMFVLLAACLASSGELRADDPFVLDGGETDLFELPIEQLIEVPVTSVAGVAEEWFTTPAAIHVISERDIQRSGHRSLAEVLRLAPGTHVARIGSSNWGVSVRGGNGLFANKLLVMIDDRPVYNPLFSGVFWDTQDVLLADLDQIEVVRGPGATIWGANAVNGVINVVSKPAAETLGWHISGGVGTELQGFGEVRYGGTIDADTHFRVWSKYVNHDNYETPDGDDRPDDWHILHAGFRLDREVDHDTMLSVWSDFHGSNRIGGEVREPVPGMHQVFTPRASDDEAYGGSVQARLTRENPLDNSGWRVQAYYWGFGFDRLDGAEAELHTVDLEWRHHFRPFDRHELIWGVGYRAVVSSTSGSPSVTLDPANRTTHLFTTFVQDTYTLIPDTLFAMAGVKLEHNDYTGFEFQPSARLSWTPHKDHTVWASISRAVHTPSLAEDSASIHGGFVGVGPGNSAPFVPVTIDSADDIEAENLVAYEIGYRVRPVEDLMIDLAGYYFDYSDVITIGDDGMIDNQRGYATYGAEMAATWRAADNLRFTGSYSYMFTGSEHDTLDSDPTHMFQLHSYLDVTKDIELNASLYFTDELEDESAGAYTRLDLGAAWRPTDQLELRVVGQNLLDPSHREFSDPVFQATPAEVPRSVYLQATMRF